MDDGGASQRCPFKGRRAAELARGEQLAQLNLIFDNKPVFKEELPLRMRNGLQDAWNIGKSAIVQSVATKVA